jgi:hypothetical protein
MKWHTSRSVPTCTVPHVTTKASAACDVLKPEKHFYAGGCKLLDSSKKRANHICLLQFAAELALKRVKK